MFILTSKNSAEQGAYAVENQDKENVLFFFEEEDDAERYALMLGAGWTVVLLALIGAVSEAVR